MSLRSCTGEATRSPLACVELCHRRLPHGGRTMIPLLREQLRLVVREKAFRRNLNYGGTREPSPRPRPPSLGYVEGLLEDRNTSSMQYSAPCPPPFLYPFGACVGIVCCPRIALCDAPEASSCVARLVFRYEPHVADSGMEDTVGVTSTVVHDCKRLWIPQRGMHIEFFRLYLALALHFLSSDLQRPPSISAFTFPTVLRFRQAFLSPRLRVELCFRSFRDR